MLLDIIYVVLIVLAIIKGWQKGLIVGIFSLIAIFIGLAAAIKLSAVVANYLGRNVKISEQWLPIISFAIVFIVVVLLVRLGAKAIEKLVQSVMMGLFNRICGVLLYIAIYTIVFSVIIFYVEQVGLIKKETKEKSVTYEFVQPWGPKAMNAMGAVIPIFKDMFIDLQEFFGKVANKAEK